DRAHAWTSAPQYWQKRTPGARLAPQNSQYLSWDRDSFCSKLDASTRTGTGFTSTIGSGSGVFITENEETLDAGSIFFCVATTRHVDMTTVSAKNIQRNVVMNEPSPMKIVKKMMTNKKGRGMQQKQKDGGRLVVAFENMALCMQAAVGS
nr:hypothetical protein [Candidatus Sigynarchaeota archaeon]